MQMILVCSIHISDMNVERIVSWSTWHEIEHLEVKETISSTCIGYFRFLIRWIHSTFITSLILHYNQWLMFSMRRSIQQEKKYASLVDRIDIHICNEYKWYTKWSVHHFGIKWTTRAIITMIVVITFHKCNCCHH